MGDIVKHIIETYGTAGLLVAIFIESGILPLPLPGDSLLFLAGLYSSTQAKSGDPHLNLAVVVLGSIAVAIAGAQIGYHVGERYGIKLFKPGAKLFKERYLHQSHDFFERRGALAVTLARFVPFVRSIVPLLAGASEMKTRAYVMANVAGAVVWAGGVSLLGYFLGSHIPEGAVEPVTAGIVILSLIPPFLEWRKHRKTVAETP